MAGSQAIGCATSPDRRTGGASLPLWTRARCLHSAMMQAWIIGDLRAMVIIAYAVVIFAIITLFKGVRIVAQGFERKVESFGRYDRDRKCVVEGKRGFGRVDPRGDRLMKKK